MTAKDIETMDFRELLELMGMTQTACARRFRLPLRTINNWAQGRRPCPLYIRLMMAELTGIIIYDPDDNN